MPIDASELGRCPSAYSHRANTPGSELVDHATRIGISLKSADFVRSGRRALPPSRNSSRPVSSQTSRSKNKSLHAPSYIQNVVVPLGVSSDSDGTAQTNPSRSLHSGQSGRFPQVHLSSRSPRHSAKSYSTGVASTIDSRYRYSSTPQEDSLRWKNTKSTEPGERPKSWNSSQQNARYEAEQVNRLTTRAIKRTSEICPHRLDRMYFMTGSSIKPQNKYSIDEQEISRLQQMAVARKQTKHYGRGLSSKGDQCASEISEKESSKSFSKTDLPQQPPPSSLSHVESLSPEDAALTTNNTPSGGSKETNKLPPGGGEERNKMPSGGIDLNNKMPPDGGEESSVKKRLSISRSLDEDSVSMFDEQGAYEEHDKNGDNTVPSGGDDDKQKDVQNTAGDNKLATQSLAASSAETNDKINTS